MAHFCSAPESRVALRFGPFVGSSLVAACRAGSMSTVRLRRLAGCQLRLASASRTRHWQPFGEPLVPTPALCCLISILCSCVRRSGSLKPASLNPNPNPSLNPNPNLVGLSRYGSGLVINVINFINLVSSSFWLGFRFARFVSPSDLRIFASSHLQTLGSSNLKAL